MQLESTLTCPKCGHQAVETMPTDACQFFYDCKDCGERLKPVPGDCCVFCSYGSVPCPPIQENGKGRAAARPPSRAWLPRLRHRVYNARATKARRT